MPGSNPFIVQPVPTREACCAQCLGTSWCVRAVFQRGIQSCNMHSSADDGKPFKATSPGQWGCATGRHIGEAR